MKPVVVKVGGSLYDHPHLGPGLRAYLDALDADRVLVVAGGGPFADAVRDLQARQPVPDAVAHDLAVSACDVSAKFLEHALAGRAEVLSVSRFLHCYEADHGPVPHTWDVTTDSIAALAARVVNAPLVLLKSVDVPPGTPWPEAAARGWVDGYFPTAADGLAVPVTVVNFRRWLDEHSAGRGEQ